LVDNFAGNQIPGVIIYDEVNSFGNLFFHKKLDEGTFNFNSIATNRNSPDAIYSVEITF
jgi:hypothetical protein